MRNAIVTTPTTAVRTLRAIESAGCGEAEDTADTLLLDRLPDPVDDLVVALEEAEWPLASREVVHDVGHGFDEVGDLGDDRWDQQVGDPSDYDESRAKTSTAARARVTPRRISELDGRVEGHGEEDGDQDPADDAAARPDRPEDDEDEERDPEDHEDGLWANEDRALGSPLGSSHRMDGRGRLGRDVCRELGSSQNGRSPAPGRESNPGSLRVDELEEHPLLTLGEPGKHSTGVLRAAETT